jgi:hypothetical protein
MNLPAKFREETPKEGSRRGSGVSNPRFNEAPNGASKEATPMGKDEIFLELWMALVVAAARSDRRILQPLGEELRNLLAKKGRDSEGFETVFGLMHRIDATFDGFKTTVRR